MAQISQLLNHPKCSETEEFGRTQCSESSEQPLGSELRKVEPIISECSSKQPTPSRGCCL